MKLNPRATDSGSNPRSRALSQYDGVNVDDFPSMDTPQHSNVRTDEQKKAQGVMGMNIDVDDEDDYNKDGRGNGEMVTTPGSGSQGHSKSWDKIRKGFNLTNLDMNKSSSFTLSPSNCGSNELVKLGSPSRHSSGSNTPKNQVHRLSSQHTL